MTSLVAALVPEPFFALIRRKYVRLGALAVVDEAVSVGLPRLAAPRIVPTSRMYPVILPPPTGGCVR